jgi:hypothetical protein
MMIRVAERQHRALSASITRCGRLRVFTLSRKTVIDVKPHQEVSPDGQSISNETSTAS